MAEYKKLGKLGTKIIGKLRNGRPVILNPDGSVSTERTETIEVDGGFMNIPTMFGGKAVDVMEAIKIMRENGFIDPETKEKAAVFNNVNDAVNAARKRSKSHEPEVMNILKKAGLLDN